MSESRRLVSKSVYTVFHWSHESYQDLINLRHNTPFSRKINPLAISVPHSMQSERDLSIWLWSSLVDVICGACQNNICAYVLFCVIHGMFLLLMLKNDVVVFYSSSNWGYTMQDLWRQILWDSLWRYYMWRVQGENSGVVPYLLYILFSYPRCTKM